MWFRVNDPLNPLHGCDVKVGDPFAVSTAIPEGRSFAPIIAVRRVDVFQGDRPYQRISAPGADLGLMIDVTVALAESPIQDDVVELATDRPYGDLIEEYQLDRSDGVSMRVVSFTGGTQVALSESDGSLVRSMFYSGPAFQVRFELLEEAFNDGEEVEGLVLIMIEAEEED